jgi:hypothetical protein
VASWAPLRPCSSGLIKVAECWADPRIEWAEQRSVAAVTQALTPVCIGQSKADPEAAAKLKQFGALETSYQRHEFVMKSGWATVPAAESPNSDLADACADALSKVNPT